MWEKAKHVKFDMKTLQKNIMLQNRKGIEW